MKAPDPRPNILLAESKTLSVEVTCKSPSRGDVKHLFLLTKRGSRRRAVIKAVISSLQTTSSFLETEAVCGTNMNTAAAEIGFVVLLLALSGTVNVSILGQLDEFRDNE